MTLFNRLGNLEVELVLSFVTDTPSSLAVVSAVDRLCRASARLLKSWPARLLKSCQDARLNLRLQIVRLRHRNDITGDRILNIDQTKIRQLTHQRAIFSTLRYARVEQRPTFRHTTVVLACFMERKDVYAQLIVSRKRRASPPIVPVPEDMIISYAQRNFCTTDTMLDLVGFLDRKVNSDSEDEERPWVMILDSCCLHVNYQFRKAMRNKFPWVKTCHVPKGKSFCCNPLDISYLRFFCCRPWKPPHFEAGLPTLIPWLSKAISDLKEKTHLQELGWKHVRVPDDAWEAARAKADKYHEEGLFGRDSDTTYPASWTSLFGSDSDTSSTSEDGLGPGSDS